MAKFLSYYEQPTDNRRFFASKKRKGVYRIPLAWKPIRLLQRKKRVRKELLLSDIWISVCLSAKQQFLMLVIGIETSIDSSRILMSFV